MAIQFPLHRAISLCKLSLRHQLNCFLICAKSFVAQYLPKIQSKQRLHRFGFTLALKQSQINKSQTLAALKVQPQYATVMTIVVYAGNETYQFTDTYGLGTITDSDSSSIKVDGQTLAGGTQVTDHIYRNESQKYTYTVAGSGDTQSLFIQKDDSDNKIIIRNWMAAHNLNITLQEQAIAEKLVTPGVDFSKFNAVNDNEWRVVA